MQAKLIARSVIAGAAFFIIYLLVVILTTPNFPPLVAASIALGLNGIYIFGGVASIALQTWILGYTGTLGTCGIPKIDKSVKRSNKVTSRLNALGGIASSFFSFFALIAVGCCGTWLFILSLLPGVLGVGLSTVLIQYSTQIAQLGLILMAISNAYALLSLRRKIKAHRLHLPHP